MTWLFLISFAALLAAGGSEESGHCPEYTVVRKTEARDMTHCGFLCMRDPECETASYNKYGRHDNCELNKKTQPKNCKKVSKENDEKYVKKAKEECERKSKHSPVKPRVAKLKDDIVRNGTTYRLNCSATGDPSPRYYWTKDGKNTIPNVAAVNKSQLVIDPVSSENQGRYKCRANNTEGKVTTSAKITVYEPPRILGGPENQTFNETQNVTFTCYGAGIPTPVITWRKNNSEVLQDARTRVDTSISEIGQNFISSTLNIKESNFSDRGQYSCEFENEYGKARDNVTLTVYVKLRIAKLKDDIVRNGTTYRLNCSATGYPSPGYYWTKDGKDTIPNVASLNKRELLIDSVSSENEGNYTCRAENVQENVTTSAKITVYEPPRILAGPENQTVNETQSITFTCYGAGIPTPVITWKKNNSKVLQDVRTRVDTSISAIGQHFISTTLNIKESNFPDRGQYSCELENEYGKARSNVTLTVHVKLRIAKLKDDIVRNGTTYRLNCSATGYPSPGYYWTKDGKDTIPNVASVNKKELLIDAVSSENHGNYTCRAENVQGNVTTSAKITVYEPPRILAAPENQTVNVTQNITFTCYGAGIPTPVITWKKNNSKVLQNVRTTVDTSISAIGQHFIFSTLNIKESYYSDRGQYSCEFENEYGKTLDNVTLTVYGVNYLPLSQILANNTDYLKTLTQWLPPQTLWKLCWRASQHGWKSTDFHSRCDFKGPTVTIIKVGVYIFGGYADVEWGGSSGYRRSTNSFVFSLKNKDDLHPFQAPVKRNKDDDAIYTNNDRGPSFGGGHDIHIATNAHSTMESYTTFGNTYKPPLGSTNNDVLLAGSHSFTPSEVEVFFQR